MTDSTGPKISSWAIVIELVTSAKSVGSTNQPVSRPAGPAAADRDAGAFVGALGDVALDPVALALGDERAEAACPKSVGSPTTMPWHRLGQRLDHLVVAGAAGEDAGLGDARLAVVHDARSGSSSGIERVDVGVVEDDRGRLAAELEGAALELLAAEGADLAAGGGRAGEAHLVDVGMGDEVLAGLAIGGHDVDHAGRDAGLAR